MEFNASQLKQIYMDWVNTTDYKDLANMWVEIQTPYTDHAGDTIQLFAHRERDGYIITDFGYVLNELQMHGISMSKDGQRKHFLNRILSANGCTVSDKNHINIHFNSIELFPVCKHRLLQAIININDLFMISPSNIETLFINDVMMYLDATGVSYSAREYSISGNSGLPISFNLNIGKIPKRKQPTLHARVVNRLDKTATELIILAALDLNLGQDESIAVFINDEEKKAEEERLSILSNNAIISIPWSKRDSKLKHYQTA